MKPKFGIIKSCGDFDTDADPSGLFLHFSDCQVDVDGSTITADVSLDLFDMTYEVYHPETLIKIKEGKIDIVFN
jgi:hypothetical protein